MSRWRLALLACFVLQGCGKSAKLENAAPHGSTTVRSVLDSRILAWKTYQRPGLHLHVPEGSFAAANVSALADSAQRAREYVIGLLEEKEDTAILELFLVDSREDMRRVVGQPAAGLAQTGEKTAFFIAGKGYRPVLRHELMHVYSLLLWGEPRSGPWITEGLGTWATGACQGKPFDGIVAGFAKTDSLYSLRLLTGQFRELPELRGYMQAASLVETIHRAHGITGIRELWKRQPSATEHPLGPDGPRIEAEWRARIAASSPASLDTVALRRDGC